MVKETEGVDGKEVASCVRLARVREKSLGSDVSKDGVAVVSWVGMIASAFVPVYARGTLKQSLGLGVLALSTAALLGADPVSREIRNRSYKEFDAETAADRCVKKLRARQEKNDREKGVVAAAGI